MIDGLVREWGLEGRLVVFETVKLMVIERAIATDAP
jgi:hypothetical protein